MTVSVAAPARVAQRPHLGLRTIYASALGVWLATRWLVLVHQGAWP
jgi:hypothetical protein